MDYDIISDYTDETYEGVHALSLYITLDNYPTTEEGSHPTLLSDFTLTIDAAVCDCTLLTWDYPAPQELYTTVLKTVSDTLTINHATVNEDSKSASPPIRRCYRDDISAATPCDETTVITQVIEEGTGALPAAFDWTSGDVITF